MNRIIGCIVAALSIGISGAQAEVKLSKSGKRWSLTRDGKPYRIQGAGGPASLELLAKSGGNSTRTWGIDQLEKGKLDDAEKNGLSVAVGIWLRHDLDYSDEKQVAEQIKLAMDGVKKYKDHPAVLLWGIGNEMEGDGSRTEVWKHVEELAALIRKEDPNHPTMTVIAEIGGDKLKNLHRHCPSIDIVGINAYGGAASIPERYRMAGGTKPYILAEYGPRGPWDLPKNKIGSVDEELGEVKAETYLASYKSANADRKLCLGSYAFMWGHKQEATPTWFGMFLADGRKTLAVDALAKEWSGKRVGNRCPQIESLKLNKSGKVKVGTTLKAKLRACDPERNPLKVQWTLMEDAKRHETGGYFQETPTSFKDNILESSSQEVTFRVPKKPGLYRIFAYVGDGEGGADVANVVFRAEE